MRYPVILLFGLLGGLACAMLARAVPSPAERGEGAAAEGREVFVRKNCQYCHAVSAAGIERGASPVKMHGPDLSDVGLRLTREELWEFLRKSPKVAGRRHWKPVWGNDKDLAALVSWLSSLRVPPVPQDSPRP